MRIQAAVIASAAKQSSDLDCRVGYAPRNDDSLIPPDHRLHRRSDSRETARAASVLLSLPVAVWGSSSTNSIASGSHHLATWAADARGSRLALTSLPGSRTQTSSGRSSHLGCGDADRRRLGDAGAADRGIFQLDRADPFAARLDHVLRAVGDLQRAVGMDERRRRRCRTTGRRSMASSSSLK